MEGGRMGGGVGGGMQIQCSCMRFSKTNKGIKKQVLHFLGELIKQYELKMTKAEREFAVAPILT